MAIKQPSKTLETSTETATIRDITHHSSRLRHHLILPLLLEPNTGTTKKDPLDSSRDPHDRQQKSKEGHLLPVRYGRLNPSPTKDIPGDLIVLRTLHLRFTVHLAPPQSRSTTRPRSSWCLAPEIQLDISSRAYIWERILVLIREL